MIAPEVAARIRRLSYAEHWRIGTIAAALGVHHDTVARVVGTDRLGLASALRPLRPSVLDPYKAVLADVLAQHPRCARPGCTRCSRGAATAAAS